MRNAFPLVFVVAIASGCGSQEPPATAAPQTLAADRSAAPVGIPEVPVPVDAPDSAAASDSAAGSDRRLLVHKSPTCGCCLAWADQMRAAGFEVEIRDVEDLTPIKRKLGVPAQSASCHTAEIAGYFVEGHVPAADIERLLAERPEAKGLAVPGMPLGSPGMEVPSGATQPYAVLLVGKDGNTELFAQHGD